MSKSSLGAALLAAACCWFCGCGKEDPVDPHPVVPRAQDPAYQKEVDRLTKEKYGLMAQYQEAYQKYEAAKAADPDGKTEAFKEAAARLEAMKEKVDAFHRDARAFVARRIREDFKKSDNAQKKENNQ